MGQCVRKEVREDNNHKLEKKKRRRSRKSSSPKSSQVERERVDAKASQELFNSTNVDNTDPISEAVPLPPVTEQPAAHVKPETYSMMSPRSSEARFPITRQSSFGNVSRRPRVNNSDNTVDSHIPSPLGSDQAEGPTSPTIRQGRSSPIRRMFASPKLAPRVLFKSPLPKHLSALRREKNNSTSSLYITDTINAPNIDEIVRCMSTALQYHIKQGMGVPDGNIDRTFSEKYHPLTRELLDLVKLPDVNVIFRFVNMVFQIQKLPSECAILCLAYIERILSTGRVVLHPENWRRIVFGSILIATKVWEDESVWNVDFLDIFPCLTLVDLNHLENRFMELLQFNVLIIGSEYAKYYFELRALSTQDSFPLAPLNKEQQAKLEERGQKTNEHLSRWNETSVFRTTPKRARSMDYFDPKSPPAVLA